MTMYKKILFLFFCSALLIGCDKKENLISEVELMVSSELLIATDPVSTEEMPYLQVKEVGSESDNWLNIYGIEGFEYEVGYEYLLKVYKTKPDDRLQDIPNVKYTLIKIISKTKK